MSHDRYVSLEATETDFQGYKRHVLSFSCWKACKQYKVEIKKKKKSGKFVIEINEGNGVEAEDKQHRHK